MKKKKYNGKGAEECKELDWVELSDSLEAESDKSGNWDSDVADERWAIEYDEEKNRLVGSSDLGSNIVRETFSQIASEGILKADGAFVTGEIDAAAVNAEAKKAAAVKQTTMEVPVVEIPEDDFDYAPEKDKIIIRSDEMEPIHTKNGKLVKVRVKKEDRRSRRLDSRSAKKAKVNEPEEPVAKKSISDGKRKTKYVNVGAIPSDKPEPSSFRKKSAAWRDDQKDYEDDLAGSSDSPRRISVTQYLAIGAAIIIFAAGVMSSAVYANYRSEQNKMEAFANLPQFADYDHVSPTEEFADSEEIVEDEVFFSDSELLVEEEDGGHKSLSLVLTSVEKDLKIKLVDDTDTLVKDVEWGVVVADSDGDESEYEDEDTDGIIHLTDMNAGDYTVSIKAGKGLEGYSFPTIGQEVSVKAKVEYKVIANIREEIKKESEVNVALEDTNGNKAADVEPEVVLADTVDWVESTEIEEGDEYEEAAVDLSKTEIIIAFKDRVLAAVGNMSRMVSGIFSRNYILGMPVAGARQLAILEPGLEDYDPEEEDENPEDDNPEDDNPEDDNPEDIVIPGDDDEDDDDGDDDIIVEPGVESELVSAFLDKSEATIKVGESVTISILCIPADAKPKKVEWKSLDDKIAKVSDGVVTGVAEGKTKIEVVIDGDIKVYSDITVSDAEEANGITLSGSKTINCGESVTIEAKVLNSEEFVTEWSIDDTDIAKISAEGNTARITGIKAGKIKLTVKGSVGSSADMTIEVVGEASYSDDAQLYDSSKNKLYVYENPNYRLAKYSDYKSGLYTKFYRKIADVLYTGWQTIDGVTYYFTENHEKVTGDQVIGGLTYHFGEDGALKKGNGILGIDVSKYQPSINWSSVKASGVNYVIIRCGYRGASTGALIQDPYFTSHIKGAKDAGLKVGVYFFSTALNEAEAVEEASMCAALCSGYGINYPVFIDVEGCSRPGYNSLSAEQRTANIKAFCATIQSAGYTPGLYANKTWLSEKINTSALSCKIWLAQYNAEGPTYNGRYDIWQYTSKGHVDGISGNVDMNQSFMGY